jgi:DNA-binding SARP family transcriptional activator
MTKSASVVVRLLGSPRIERDGSPVALDTRKAIALVAYLAMAQRPIAREEIATLLWPESEHGRARAALRRTLSALTSALDGRGLIVEGDTLAVDHASAWIDVDVFHRLVNAAEVGELREGVELYRGDFLAGFGLRDSVEFDEWQLGAAQELRRDLATALERLSEALAATDVDAALGYARRLVALDPLHEAAHRSLIRLHAEKGDRAAAVRQYRECVTLLERELGVSPDAETTELYEAAHISSSPPVGAEAAKLHELMGDLWTLQGRYREARGSYETAASLGAPLGAVRRKLADVQQRLGDYEGADRLYTEALEAVDTSDAGGRARVLADRSLNAHRRGRTDEADELAAQALVEAEAAGDERALAQAHNIAGILASHRGDLDATRAHLEASIALSEKLADPVATAAALNNMALALKGSEIERALALAQRALDLCARVGDRHREAAMHSNLADLLRAAGRDEEAKGHLRLSAAIFADVGEPDESRPELWPEIWKLVEW